MTATFGLDQFSCRLLRDSKLRSFAADQSYGLTPLWFGLACHAFCRISAISRRRKVEYAWHVDLNHQVNPEQEGEEKAAAILGRKHLLRPTSKLLSLTDVRPIRECRSEHTGRN